MNNPHLLETRLNNIGAVYLKQGRLKEAENIFLERKKLETKIKPNRLLHPWLIEVYLKTGRCDEALRLANEIPPTWQDNKTRHFEYYIQTGMALKGKGNLQESAIHFMNAINIIEDMRQSVTERAQFFIGGGYYSRLTPYREIISVLVGMSEKDLNLMPGSTMTFKPEASSYEVRTRRSAFNFLTYGQNPASTAFYFSELTKARTLLEAMAEVRKKTESAEIAQELRERHLHQELSYIDRRWEEALKKGKHAVKQLQARREGVKKQLDELIEVLRKRYPRYTALYYPLPVKAEDLPLKENEVLFEYAVTDDATYLFIVRKGGVKSLIKIPVKREDLEEKVKSFIEPMNLKKPEPEKTLFALGNPVYIADDPRYIAWKQGKREHYLANLNQYAFRGLAIKEKWGTITESDNEKRLEFPPLPETEQEVREIARIMGVKPEPPQILLSVFASETNLKKAGLEKYRYIHFATHASLPGMIQGINEPFIILGQVENQGDDGFLILSEVAGMRLNADMVVLSACVTGVGKEVEGEGVVNFARAFQQAGARAVVVSLWEVASEPTVEYMRTFYSHLNSGKSMAEAMKLTRSEIKAKYPSPFYWVVFILHGEG